jgi:hypothetical protein
MSANGLSSANGLMSANGLSSANGLMTTDAGRKTITYLVRCALASNDTLVKQDQYGTTYTFGGGLGLCPAWKTGGIASNRSCQNMISACIMAHVNTAGVHIPIWLDSEHPAIGWGVDPIKYPAQEGTFFGNIIATGNLTSLGMPGVNAPVAYYCEGQGFSNGTVQGRLGAGQSGTAAPYVNPYGGKCTGVASSPTLNGVPHGYRQACAGGYCYQNGEPITVWRNPNYAPTFDRTYRYSFEPASAPGKRIDVVNGSQVNGTAVQLWSNTGLDMQKFAILASGANWKIAMKANTNKCIAPVANGTVNGTQIALQDCNGSASQAWAIAADANTVQIKSVASGRCLDAGMTTADGARLQLYDCNGAANQKFKLSSSY